MKILFFTDTDKDDLYSLIFLFIEMYKYNIEIIGIVCDDGFLSYPNNIKIMNYFVDNMINKNKYFTNMPKIYRGLDRPHYYKNTRNFPDEWIDTFTKLMTDGKIMNNDKYHSVSDLLKNIKKHEDNSINVLVTGNFTTLEYILDIDDISKKINKICAMAGNVYVNGNNINENIDSEYNAWLDSISFSNVIKKSGSKLSLIPLDCTNYVPLNYDVINDIKKISSCTNKFINEMRNIFIELLETTMKSEEDITGLYMWDTVATMIFLGNNCGQIYKKEFIDVDSYGKIICDENGTICNIYYYIDNNLLLNNLINMIKD